MQLTVIKFHKLLNTNKKVATKVDAAGIPNSQTEKLLTATIDT